MKQNATELWEEGNPGHSISVHNCPWWGSPLK